MRAQRPDKQGGLFRPWKGGVGIVVKDTLEPESPGSHLRSATSWLCALE